MDTINYKNKKSKPLTEEQKQKKKRLSKTI